MRLSASGRSRCTGHAASQPLGDATNTVHAASQPLGDASNTVHAAYQPPGGMVGGREAIDHGPIACVNRAHPYARVRFRAAVGPSHGSGLRSTIPYRPSRAPGPSRGLSSREQHKIVCYVCMPRRLGPSRASGPRRAEPPSQRPGKKMLTADATSMRCALPSRPWAGDGLVLMLGSQQQDDPQRSDMILPVGLRGKTRF